MADGARPPEGSGAGAAARDTRLDDDRYWKEFAWIKGSSDLKGGQIRVMRWREKDNPNAKVIRSRKRRGRRKEYFLPDVIDAFPAATSELLEHIRRIISQTTVT
jgi:N-glycosylase/DNA lyase